VEKYIANSLGDLPEIAKKILQKISPQKPLLLNGELGAGKTTLVKFIAKELKINEVVNSPSFVIMKLYPSLVHIDAYRISGTLDEYVDYFEDDKYIIIE
jgi:tRNA threonylcarbamoyladenosine biosynthesis protein TsaE